MAAIMDSTGQAHISALPETSRQCEKQITDFNPWVLEKSNNSEYGYYTREYYRRQCKRRATIGEKHCFQHGGGRCYCARYEKHHGTCRGPNCYCH
jgi:hypothetical protein